MESNAVVSKIDDRDPSIAYSTGWFPAGTSNEFDNTTTGTYIRGSTAVVNFVGVGISVFGTVPEGSFDIPASSYTIDGGISVLYSAPTANNIIYSQQFFQSPNLKQGQHDLVILDLGVPGNYTLYLDYMLISSLPAPTTTSSIVTVTQTVSSNSTTIWSVPPPTIAAISRATIETHRWAIAGVSIAGAIVILLLAVLGFFLWRRRNRSLALLQSTNTG